jgi:hypothetical protein
VPGETSKSDADSCASINIDNDSQFTSGKITNCEDGYCHSETIFHIEIASLGISVIAKNGPIPIEALYLWFKGLEYFTKTAPDHKLTQFRVKNINIDNNSTKYTKYPKLLSPTHPASLHPTTPNYLINLLINQTILPDHLNFPNISRIRQFSLDLAPLTLTLDEHLINILYSMVTSLQQAMSTSSLTYLHKYFHITDGSKNIFYTAEVNENNIYCYED